MKILPILIVCMCASFVVSTPAHAKKEKYTKCTPVTTEQKNIIALNQSTGSKLWDVESKFRGKKYSEVLAETNEILENSRLNTANLMNALELKSRALFRLGRTLETQSVLEIARDTAKSSRVRDEYSAYLETLKTTQTYHHKLDDDPIIYIRIPPIMPRKATKSGHCDMIFDFDSQKNKVGNIRTLFCSDPVFAKPSKKALSKWLFRSAKTPAGNKDVETTIRYILMDECGNAIPE